MVMELMVVELMVVELMVVELMVVEEVWFTGGVDSVGECERFSGCIGI